jgi:hypothetical protein
VGAEKKQRCARCGKRLKKGGMAYRLKAELLSHFDGYLHDSGDGLAELVSKIGTEMEQLTEEELEKQIYQRFDYIICPVCRDEIEHFLHPTENTTKEESV